jgi:hypothetical protein
MPGETAKRPMEDEDTVVGFQGHITHQNDESPEQVPDDRNRRQTGLGRTSDHSGTTDGRSGKKDNRGNWK